MRPEFEKPTSHALQNGEPERAVSALQKLLSMRHNALPERLINVKLTGRRDLVEIVVLPACNRSDFRRTSDSATI